MFARALLAFLALPGVVAILVPILWLRATSHTTGGMFVYAVLLAFAFHVRVVTGEEPWLARTHGDEWESCRSRVPRWIR